MLEAIAADPDGVFGSLRGVSAKQAAAAAESWHACRAVRDLHVQLAPHGLAHLAAPIHARFGERSMIVLHEDPYRLTEVDGVGFARADKIALAADVPPRVRAAAPRPPPSSPSPRPSSRATPTCRSPSWRSAPPKLLGLDPDPDVLVAARGLLVEEGRVYREPTHASEIAVAETLRARAAAPPQPRP